MPGGSIIDNWTLQDIADCLVEGLDPGAASEIVIDVGRDSHSFRDVPHAAIQIEALLNLLTDVVLQDSLYVDSGFTNVWENRGSVYESLITPGLLRLVPFLNHEITLAEPRKYLVSSLCVTSSIAAAQTANEESWNTRRRAANPFMSALVWGTAGMLGRSHVFEVPYHGHPSRNRLIDQALFAKPTHDAVGKTTAWIANERMRIFECPVKNGALRRASVVLPPLAIEVINNSRDVTQLIPTAYELRDKYRPLRQWLRDMQLGLESEDARAVARFNKKLSAISRDLDALLGKSALFDTSIEFSYGCPSPSVKLPIMTGIRKTFGISAMLHRLLLSEGGGKPLKRLLGMFGDRGRTLELSVGSYFCRRD